MFFLHCNSQLEIGNWHFSHGVLAQLVERLNGIEEVRGSNPLGSRPESFRGWSAEALAKADVIQLATNLQRATTRQANYGIDVFDYLFRTLSDRLSSIILLRDFCSR